MKASTIRLASFIALLLVVGCHDRQTSYAIGPSDVALVQASDTLSAAQKAAPDAEPAPGVGDAELIRITSFDCQKVTGSPNERLDRGIPPGAGISGWNNGGPAGAVWNAFDLHCATDIRVSCSKGEVLTELRVGRTLVATGRHALAGRAELHWSTILPEKKWERNLDDRSPTAKYYRSGIFRVAAMLSCKEPEPIAPGLASHRAVVTDRAFTAGFASGE